MVKKIAVGGCGISAASAIDQFGLFAFSTVSLSLHDPRDDEDHQVLDRAHSFAHRGTPLLRQVGTPLKSAHP